MEYIMIAVPIVVGGTPKLSTIPPMETGRAATLKDIRACPMAMTTMANHGSRADLVLLIINRDLNVWFGGKEMEADFLGKELCRELALYAVSGRVQSWTKRAEPAFAG